jgi:hypothetical protein
MRRRDDTPTPELQRELAAIDAALAGEPVEPELSELGALALTLRTDRPRPRPQFAAALDERAAAGFAQPAPRTTHRRARRALLPALGLAATAALVAVVVLPGTKGPVRGDSSSSARFPGAQTAPGVAAPGPSATAESGGGAATAAPAPKARSAPSTIVPSSAADSVPAPARKVERSAALVLAARPGDIPDVADGVVRVTDRVGGFVLSSNVSTDDARGGGAEFTLRVPSRRLPDAMSGLSALAHVRSRTQASDDITSQFNSAVNRLSDARAERRSLLRQLARATTPNQTTSIRARLRIVASQIAAAKGRLGSVRRRADLSTVDVAIRPDRHASTGGGSWTPGDALHDAVRVLAVAAGVALVALAAGLPLALLAAAGHAASVALRRRRREGALDLA